MKTKSLLIIFIVAILFSCKKKDEERTSILGSWNCEHFSDINGQKVYQASITSSPLFDSLYVISNFHNFGINEEDQVYFSKNANGELILDFFGNSQIQVAGKGIVADDFSKITWTYTVDNGTAFETVDAIYH
ncbi:MAG: hypothetical protein JEZ09_04250 [Salinivirgaceae bacterium]|nr:hypothetical protein [Salinivirgaceae bacterium]